MNLYLFGKRVVIDPAVDTGVVGFGVHAAKDVLVGVLFSFGIFHLVVEWEDGE
jgi:hypothetical protein